MAERSWNWRCVEAADGRRRDRSEPSCDRSRSAHLAQEAEQRFVDAIARFQLRPVADAFEPEETAKIRRRLSHERGYSASGVREITRAAGAPLGSFTNHFRSKEEFGALVLDRYMATLRDVVSHTLRDASRPPLDRIAAYFAAIENEAAPIEWRLGCMVANMGLELPNLSEPVRARLAAALGEFTEPFADAIRAAQKAGQARTDVAARDLAVIVLSAWHGALLRAKVERSGEAPAIFARTLPLLLGGE